MKSFPQPLLLRALAPDELVDKAQLYQVQAPFVYVSEKFGMLTVPAGVITDFASIPRLVWNLLDPEDPIILFASVVHDWLYTTHALSRSDADAILAEAMTVCGADQFQVFAVHSAVRMFGGAHYHP